MIRELVFAGERLEYRATATAGVTGEVYWWGSYVQFRRADTRQAWRHMVAADVHPFDVELVELALRVFLANELEEHRRRAALGNGGAK